MYWKAVWLSPIPVLSTVWTSTILSLLFTNYSAAIENKSEVIGLTVSNVKPLFKCPK